MVSEIQFTRCPGCATVYRVTAEQLALREGQVRCGRCRAVFDATMHAVEIDPVISGATKAADPGPPASSAGTLPTPEAERKPASEEVPAPAIEPDIAPIPAPAHEAVTEPAPESEFAPEPGMAQEPGMAPESGMAPEPGIAQEPGMAPESGMAPGSGMASEREDAPPDLAELEAARAALRPRGARARSGNVFYAIAALVLVAALGVQAIALFGVDLVARLPSSGPAVAALCKWIDCRIGPGRDVGSLSIEGSDLRPDPGHRGLLVLKATLRNRAGRPVAWPDIELTLTDSSDQAVARRVLAPADYLPPGTGGAGFDAHSEREIQLFLDVSATRQAGYRLYLFYP